MCADAIYFYDDTLVNVRKVDIIFGFHYVDMLLNKIVLAGEYVESSREPDQSTRSSNSARRSSRSRGTRSNSKSAHFTLIFDSQNDFKSRVVEYHRGHEGGLCVICFRVMSREATAGQGQQKKMITRRFSNTLSRRISSLF
jgi:hypothetical protein